MRNHVDIDKVNVISAALDEALDERGFRHAATTVNLRLGAQRIGASVYEAEAGLPIWPYHYHHGIEEWLYVIAGAPVLREPAGERVLAPGDLVCFPSGHVGAHTVKGPGRFMICAAGQYDEPYLSVYPDSDKVSGPGGILLRSSAVGYWHGEGSDRGSEPAEFAREPESSPPRPAVNVPALPAQPATGLGSLLGAARLDGEVVNVAPGEASEPYHYVFGRETWLLVVAGTPTVRHPDGEEQLEPGDLVCFREGPAGAHQLLGSGESAVRALFVSTTGLPANVYYPDLGQWLMRNGSGPDEIAVGRGG
jgi:uncharacterized cupin superfamily protein